jgi:hypothetical protein
MLLTRGTQVIVEAVLVPERVPARTTCGCGLSVGVVDVGVDVVERASVEVLLRDDVTAAGVHPAPSSPTPRR